MRSLLLFIALAASVHAQVINASGFIGKARMDNGQVAYGTNAQGLLQPSGVCTDQVAGYVFVNDSGNSRIVAYPLASGLPTVTTGTHVLGSSALDFQINNSQSPTQANLGGVSTIGAMICDSAGKRLFVADRLNNRVMIWDLSAGITDNMNAAFVLGQINFTSNALATTQTGMKAPQGLAFDVAGQRLFVADSTNKRVLVFDVSPANLIATQPGFGTASSATKVLGSTVFTSSTGGNTASLFNTVSGLAYDPTNSRLFVAIFNQARVLSFNVATITNGQAATYVWGNTSLSGSGSGSGTNGFASARGLAFDVAHQLLYVSDTSNFRVIQFDALPATLITNGLGEDGSIVLGQTDFFSTLGQEQPALNNTFKGIVSDMYYDAISGVLYVIDQDNNRVMGFTTASLANAQAATYLLGHVNLAGALQFGAPDASNNPNETNEYNPHQICIDYVHHRAFVAQYGDQVSTVFMNVLVYHLDSNNHFTSGTAYAVIGWPGLFTPPPAGSNSPVVSAALLGTVTGTIAYDSANQRLFVSDPAYNRVLVFVVTDGSTLTGISASYVLGQADMVSSGAATTATGMNQPGPLAYDAVNLRLFVLDADNNRILVFTVPLATNLTGRAALYAIGQADLVSAVAATTATGLSTVYSGVLYGTMDYDATGLRLFAPDWLNHRVLVFAVPLSTNLTGIAASKVLGQSDFVSSGAATTRAGMLTPAGVSYDSTWGRLFVGDINASRVTIYDASVAGITNGENAQAAIGQPDFTTATSNSFALNGNGRNIGSAFTPSSNTLFQVQYAPDRTVQYDMVHITTSTLPAGSSGSAYSQTVTATNNQATLSYAVQSGALPTGLSLNTSTGAITGTPSATGPFTFVIEADDTYTSGVLWDRLSYTVTIAAASAGGAGSVAFIGYRPIQPVIGPQ